MSAQHFLCFPILIYATNLPGDASLSVVVQFTQSSWKFTNKVVAVSLEKKKFAWHCIQMKLNCDTSLSH